MLIIATKDVAVKVYWHIGDKFHWESYDDIEYIQADCSELDYILYHFKNLPYSSARVQRWYGDIAKQIAYFLQN